MAKKPQAPIEPLRIDAYEVEPGLFYGSVYWTYGTPPGAVRENIPEVKDPPTSGNAHCFVIDKGGKFVTLFCPFSLNSYQVSRTAPELRSMRRDLEYEPIPGKNPPNYRPIGPKPWSLERQAKLIKIIHGTWEACGRYGWQRDFDTAAMVLQMMKAEVPIRVVPEGEEEKVRGGKEADVLGLLKPVKRKSRTGQVLGFFIGGPRSIREGMAEFGISRSNLLSQLYLLQKNHGIGYTLTGDAAIIQLPQGCTDPFDTPEEKAA